MKKMLFIVAAMATTLMACNKQTCDKQTCDKEACEKQICEKQVCDKQTKAEVKAVSFSGEWTLTEINGKQIESEEGKPAPFIIFDTNENKVNGNAGCNSFFGSFITDTTNPSALKFDNMGSTKMMCANMETEDNFFMAMGQVSSIECNASTLQLKDKDNNVVLTFVRK